MSTNKVPHRDPTKTTTGKIRLGPLNLKQLNEMLAKESKPKNKSKIQNRIGALTKNQPRLVPKSLAESPTETV